MVHGAVACLCVAGSYGVVYKGRYKAMGQVVAMTHWHHHSEAGYTSGIRGHEEHHHHHGADGAMGEPLGGGP